MHLLVNNSAENEEQITRMHTRTHTCAVQSKAKKCKGEQDGNDQQHIIQTNTLAVQAHIGKRDEHIQKRDITE